MKNKNIFLWSLVVCFIISGILYKRYKDRQNPDLKYIGTEYIYDTAIINNEGIMQSRIYNLETGGHDFIPEVNLWKTIDKNSGVSAKIRTFTKMRVHVKKAVTISNKEDSLGGYYFIITEKGDSGWLLTPFVRLNN